MAEGNGVAQTPEQAMYASVQGKLCPLLSMAAMGHKEESRLISASAPQEPKAQAIGCQGPGCMWFTPVADEKGAIRGGNCVISLLPSALTQNNIAIAGAFQHFVSSFKLKATPRT